MTSLPRNPFTFVALLAAISLAAFAPGVCWAQAADAPISADALAEAALAEPPPVEAEPDASSAPILQLLFKGGWLMAPIAVMSILVLAVAIERALGLRRSNVAPRALTRGIRQLAEIGDFEPRTAYRLCRDYPSAAARVMTAMLLKSGRPHAEVEAAAAEATQREADRMYGPVRNLNLAAAVAPLMGLLGTVWGMIAAFFVTASMPLGSNKGQALAEGIYVALVTTFAGLAVAIPAAVLAHYFEGRILRGVRLIEDLVAAVLPRMERLEGGPRVDPDWLEGGDPPLHVAGVEDSGEGAWSAGEGSVEGSHPGPPAPHEARQREAKPWQG